jgi:hypothetical protein
VGSLQQIGQDKLIRAAEKRIGEQKARLQTLIVRGDATQSADDILAAIYVELRNLQRLRSKAAPAPVGKI